MAFLSVQLGFVLGLVLLALLMAVLQFASRLFTEDIEVLKLISIGIPVLLLPEPLMTRMPLPLFSVHCRAVSLK